MQGPLLSYVPEMLMTHVQRDETLLSSTSTTSMDGFVRLRYPLYTPKLIQGTYVCRDMFAAPQSDLYRIPCLHLSWAVELICLNISGLIAI